METEIWKEILGYESLYLISNLGRVKSLRKHGDFFLRCSPNSYGYPTACLIKDGVYKQIKVHSLLAKHFIPNPENKPEVNHKNGNKGDNRLENLEWVTHKENLNHAFDTNLSAHGERSYKAKLTNEDVLQIMKFRHCRGVGLKLAELYSVSYVTIVKIWAGVTWRRLTGLKTYQAKMIDIRRAEKYKERKKEQVVK